MRVRAVALVCMLVAPVAFGVAMGRAAQASCAAPSMEVSPNQAPQGATITINGEGFFDGCNDVITCTVFTPTPTPAPGSPTPTPSPTSTCEPREPVPATKDITIKFFQDGRSWKLGKVDAHSDGRFVLEAEVPADADFGAAQIKACSPACQWPAPFRVGSLATTGRGLRSLTVAGAAALIVGAFLLVASRALRSKPR